MVDALVSGTSDRKVVWVQLPPSVPPPPQGIPTRSAKVHQPRWRNWYTRTFEGRMRQLIRVQVPAWAPLPDLSGRPTAACSCSGPVAALPGG